MHAANDIQHKDRRGQVGEKQWQSASRGSERQGEHRQYIDLFHPLGTHSTIRPANDNIRTGRPKALQSVQLINCSLTDLCRCKVQSSDDSLNKSVRLHAQASSQYNSA